MVRRLRKNPRQHALPDWAHPDPDVIAQRQAINAAADPKTRRLLQEQKNQERYSQMADLRYWWVRRMALGPRPFQEKMTLLWHGHFATSFDEVPLNQTRAYFSRQS